MNATNNSQKRRICITVTAALGEPAVYLVLLRSPPAPRRSWLRFQRLDHGGNDFEQVADDAVLGDLEDRRVGVLVDGDDGLTALHADQMLDGAGDAECE